jgi:hypothetical protein
MPQALAGILPDILAGTTAAGAAGNVYGDIEAGKTAGLQQKQLQNELSYENNPAKFAALVRSFMTPLSQGLIQSVTRGADASGAASGLSDSPGLMSYIVSQALAPYALQEQQQAGNEASQVAFPGSAGTPQYPQSNLTGSFAMLQKMFPQLFSGTSGVNPSAVAANSQGFEQGLGTFTDPASQQSTTPDYFGLGFGS